MEWTKKEMEYAIRVARDALKAEGIPGALVILGYYYPTKDRVVKNIHVQNPKFPGFWARVDRRINYRLSRNWQKHFKSTPAEAASNTTNKVVLEIEVR